MKNPIKAFKDRLKVNISHKPIEKKESLEEEAIRLALELDAVFVNAPMFKPYKGEWNKIQLDEQCIESINSILTTTNKLILENDFYNSVKQDLQSLLRKNSNGIEVDYIVNLSTDVKRLYYSLQTKEYWENKEF